MTDDLQFNVDVNTGASDAQVKSLATALAGLSDQMRDLGKSATSIANQTERVERSLSNLKSGAKDAASALKTLNQQQSKVSTEGSAATAFAKQKRDEIHPGLAATEYAKAHAEALRLAGDEAKITAEKKTQLEALRKQVELTKQIRTAGGMGPKLETGTHAGSAEDVAKRFISSGLIMRQEADAQSAAIKKLGDANMSAAKAELEHMNRLTNLRYTLYDVQRSFLVTGLGLAAFNVLTLKAAMDYETAMAQISRTSNVTGTALSEIRGEFIELAQSIPTNFSTLAEIGTLGGQLNIPSERLADFTKVVAQFTTTTNVAAEQSATAFGRLDALLPDVQGNYEALGSSILNVGVNSVATESEIINTTNQIAAAGQQAGLTASQIIGLAASFASLGVAPEASRGTTIRFFSEINKAIATNSEELGKFASMSGKSAEKFKADWSADAGQAFLDLIEGMQKLGAEGTNVESVLRSMGITAVRDINALLKLSQNAEIVAANFGYAAEGFADATQLGDAFAVQSATLASKLQILANTVQALFAEMGESGLPIVGAIVDGISGLVKLLTSFAKVPAVQFATVFVGALTSLVAIVSLAGFAMTRLLSATIAVRTALVTLKVEAYGASGGLGAASTQAKGLAGALFGASTAANVFKGALLSTGIGAAALVVGASIQGLIEIVDSFKPATEKAKAAFGDLSTLTDALAADTKAAEGGAQVYGNITGSITTTRQAQAEWASELENATGAQLDLSDATSVTNTTVKDQTYAIGENTAQWLANQLVTNKALQDLFKLNSELATQGAPTLDMDTLVSAAVTNDTVKAKQVLEKFKVDYTAWAAKTGAATGPILVANGKLGEILELTGGALEGAANSANVTKAVYDALGISSESTAKYQEDLGDALTGTASAAQVLADGIASAFNGQNLVGQMGQDFYALAEGIYTGGTAIDAFSQNGMTNLSNFQSAIASTIAAGQTLGVSTADSVAALFLQLQAMGIDTANLLASVAKIPGINIGAVTTAMTKLTPKGQQLSDVLGGISNSAKSAGKSLGGSGGTAGGAKKATQEIKTLVDYGSDLRQVLSRAFDIRFSVGDATDKIASGWSAVADATQDALDSIRDIQNELQQLNSDKSINQYFLGIAEMYDDTLRAADIRAKLSDIDADIADNTKKLNKEQGKANKTLVGNTDAAVDNRKTITDLVKSYEDLIVQYASTGMDQAALSAKTAELRAQFLAQATALGYSSTELQTYASAFDDITLAIARVPRNITVSANTNPAEQALAEFLAKVASSTANVGLGAASSGGDGYNAGYNAGAAYASGWNDAVARGRKIRTYNNAAVPGGKTYRVEYANGSLGPEFFKKGGYTGNVGVNAQAGIVHGKEFVVNAENTAKFRPILEAMNKGRMPAMSGATQPMPSTMMVELSPVDRQLLAAAGNVALFLDGRAITGAVNQTNVTTTTRGAN